MKRGLFILIFGLAAAVVVYGCVYFACISSVRDFERSERPELVWLKDEFKLSDIEFERVSELHAAYLPQCRAMCRQIDAQNMELQRILGHSTNLSPELEQALNTSARLRAECQAMMLKHFFDVSGTMPAKQGQRYLSWVKERAFLQNHGMAGH